ncbi:hypothetical protein PsYK624_035620 [Phanerochaete sordida]|uniref:Uncharacterized protein n=1 Tax=Phanerochaete sordida TaxID=48140 RepID=A0A9P3G424_9APHY|nr:hypothetical protein PsYK624_035620 [Phanerochaete sordida]
MTRADSPPSPLHSPPRSSESSRSSRSRRSSKDRENRLGSAASREFVKLLIHEEQETRQLRDMVHTLSERLNSESARADAAESRAQDAVLRFKQVNDARLAALQDATRLHEELELYKLQLDNAQREIRRAQELLDALEAQRSDAEEAAARARSTARKLKEEKLMQLARDEGKLEGMREGLARGRLLGYEEGRSEVYTRGRPRPARNSDRGTATPPDDTLPAMPSDRGYSPPRSDSTDQGRQLQEQPVPAQPAPPPENIVVHPPGMQAVQQSPPRTPSPQIHPIPIHTAPPSRSHTPVDYPQEGWIPSVDADQRIRLPPPHEMSPSPFTPGHTPPPTYHLPPTPEQPILMIPPPSHRVEPVRDNDSIGSHRLRRRRSSDSQSTTFSQFDIISPPDAPYARTNPSQRPNVLSAIVEERSLEPSPYLQTSSPRAPSPVPVPLPAPQASAPITPIIPHIVREDYYRRPGSTSSAATSTQRGPSRTQSRGHLRPPPASPKGSIQSNAGFNITVEPPSRPESGRSGFMAAEQGMLSANDAEVPPAPATPVQSQPLQVPEPRLQPSPKPIPIPHGQLPPGFVPLGPPVASPQSNAQHVGETPAMYGLYTPAASAGEPSHSSEPVVVPLPASSGARRYSRSALQKDSSTESSSVSEDADLSTTSMDSFTTPPPRTTPRSRPTYEAAETPPNVVYPLPPSRPAASRTSSAARVPLPPSTVADSPHTSTVTGARVPLPASSVGSPRSVYTRMSRRGAATPSTVGPQSQSPPIMLPPRSDS